MIEAAISSQIIAQNISGDKKLKILIAEDNRHNSELLASMLSSYGGYDIAENGQQAYDMFINAHNEEDPYDIVFLDIIMPVIEGDQVLNMIREWEGSHLQGQEPVPIVMATAKSDTGTIVDSYDKGCNKFIMKPYWKPELVELMESLRHK